MSLENNKRWYYVNYNDIIKFHISISEYFDYCKDKHTCAIELGNIKESSFGTVYFVDFDSMIFFNERSRDKFYLINEYENSEKKVMYLNEMQKVKREHLRNVFVPYCCHSPYYHVSLFNYPEITDVCLLSNCLHTHGCHNRYCLTHNGVLKGFYSLNECNNNILNMRDCKYIYNINK